MRSLVKFTNSPSLDQGKKTVVIYPAQLPTSQLTCAKANSETVKENLREQRGAAVGNFSGKFLQCWGEENV